MPSTLRRLCAVSALLVLVLGATPAAATGRGERSRVVSGRLTTAHATLDVVGLDDAICAWQRLGESSQGRLGWVVPLSAREGDGSHWISLRAAQASEGFSSSMTVTTFRSLGTCGLGADPPHGLGYGTSAGYDYGGRLPRGSRYAVVTMQYEPISVFYAPPFVWPGAPPGADQAFTLTVSPSWRPPPHWG